MNKQELLDLGVEEDVAQKIIVLHGKNIERHKKALAEAEEKVTDLESELKEAGSKLEAQADTSEKLADLEDQVASLTAERDKAREQAGKLHTDYKVDMALHTAKARNLKAVKALLDLDSIQYSEEDDTLTGLEDQLETLQTEHDYLFSPDTGASEEPSNDGKRLVFGSSGESPPPTDALVAAAKKAANLE